MKIKPGKMLWLVVLGIGAIILVVTLLPLRSSDDIQKSLAETRQDLRDHGFKTDLTDFDLSSPGDPRVRAEDILNNSYALPRELVTAEPNLMPSVTADSVAVVWQQDLIHTRSDTTAWATLHDLLDPVGPALDADVAAALGGPLRFNLDSREGFAMRLPHITALRSASQVLAGRAMLELHDGHDGPAWTNLLALTHLVTDWDPEPAEISHLMRCNLANTAFNATWQTLQKKDWTEEQLAGLQREWTTVDFFHGLPDTLAFRRAGAVDLCQRNRTDPVLGRTPPPGFGSPAVHAPTLTLAGIHDAWQEARYRGYGTYADERNLLLFYRDREVEMRNAIKATNWLQMEVMPGVTNAPLFTSPYRSRLQLELSTRDMGLRFQRLGGGLFGRAAVTETRRRIVITALALERYRIRHGAYPATLAMLTAEFPDTTTIDFMDGNPLRYHLTDDGHFILYSVGLDGVDNGGTLSTTTPRRVSGGMVGFFGAEDTDIVWPRPATDAEMKTLDETESNELQQKAYETETEIANAQWEKSDRRQAGADKILSSKPDPLDHIPGISGHPLTDILRNPQSCGTNQFSLFQMLTLHQVITGNEPESVTFQVPIAYDVLTNLGNLSLLIDAVADTDTEGSSEVEQSTFERATNGDCLLHWNTIFESPGRHALQFGLTLDDHALQPNEFLGPTSLFTISNLCQFCTASANYDPAVGAILHARLPEDNATYTIDCNLPDGTHVKTISGQSTNGEIKILWDLKNDHGQRMTNEDFNTVFHLKLTDSGRTQTLRGP